MKVEVITFRRPPCIFFLKVDKIVNFEDESRSTRVFNTRVYGETDKKSPKIMTSVGTLCDEV